MGGKSHWKADTLFQAEPCWPAFKTWGLAQFRFSMIWLHRDKKIPEKKIGMALPCRFRLLKTNFLAITGAEGRTFLTKICAFRGRVPRKALLSRTGVILAMRMKALAIKKKREKRGLDLRLYRNDESAWLCHADFYETITFFKTRWNLFFAGGLF